MQTMAVLSELDYCTS